MNIFEITHNNKYKISNTGFGSTSGKDVHRQRDHR